MLYVTLGESVNAVSQSY